MSHGHRIQEFLNTREKALSDERALRSDYEFRKSLSPAAKAACEIVERIRREEHTKLWTKDFEDSLAEREGDIYPGMMFILAKKRMEQSTLYQIIRDMPKGALLHCHLEAMVDINWVVNEALQTEGLHIKANGPLCSAQARLKTPFLFQYVHPKHAEKLPAANIWTSSYEAGIWVPLTQAAKAFPDGGREGFIAWIVSRCSITPKESISHHLGTNEVWRKFISCFPILGSIIDYEPIFRKFVLKMCLDLRRDGVQWVDIRAVWSRPFYREGAEEPYPDINAKLIAMKETIALAASSASEGEWEREQGPRSDRHRKKIMPPFWGGRLIWSTIRSLERDEVIKDMKTCIEMKLKHPELIAGFDFVGQEDLGRPLTDLLPELFWFQDACKEAGVDIPLFLHAGETLGTGDDTDNNLHTAIQLGARRLGHGFSLYKHPTLIDAVKQQQILIESCPISNEVLRFTGSIMSHPLPALLARGVPVALSNDDPAILGQGQSGMTHDFWQALQGWENLGLAGLGSLAQNSVRWANYENLTEEEWHLEIKTGGKNGGLRSQRLNQWNREWELFCLRVVANYGDDLVWNEVINDHKVQELLNS